MEWKRKSKRAKYISGICSFRRLDDYYSIKLWISSRDTVYEYDELGNRSALHYPNGDVVSYTYDACQRLKEELVTDVSGNQIAKYSYGLGKAGERLTVTEEELSVTSAGITDRVKTETKYEYDKLNRLTE